MILTETVANRMLAMQTVARQRGNWNPSKSLFGASKMESVISGTVY